MTWTTHDFQFMSRAIQLAKRGRYTCDPNPRVGCVITRNNEVIAEGWHVRCGEAHAEINALNQISDASGSTVYITLEPCSHHGRTAPCVETLIKANVKQVIIAMLDPNPLVSGKGVKQLENSGISVKQGLLEEESKKLNPGFIKRMESERPYVRCKMAMSLDGRIALLNGDSQWISSEQSRRDVHKLRASSSAVLTSVNTIIDDDASLNARGLDFDVEQPVRVVIDRKFKIPLDAKIFSHSSKIIIYTETDNTDRIKELDESEVDVINITASDTWLEQVFNHLAKEYEINDVMVEAGATFSGALLEAELVDELIIYMAALLLGDKAQPLLKLKELTELGNAKKISLIDVKNMGDDLRLSYKLNNK